MCSPVGRIDKLVILVRLDDRGYLSSSCCLKNVVLEVLAFFHCVKTTWREDSLNDMLAFLAVSSHCSGYLLTMLSSVAYLYLWRYYLYREWAQHLCSSVLISVLCIGFWLETAIISCISKYLRISSQFFMFQVFTLRGLQSKQIPHTCNFESLSISCQSELLEGIEMLFWIS